MTSIPTGSAASLGLVCCHVCLKVSDVSLHRCPLCLSPLHLRKPFSLQRTLALVVTASLLYIPANILPIMTTTQLGRPTESTILGGVVLLVEHEAYVVAGVIFVASVLVPITKMLALIWLCWSVYRRYETSHRERTRLYRITELIGKWSMTDVFVVSILVGLIQLGGFLRITAGVAAIAFGGVVIVTMFAAESFDSRMMWDQLEESDG